MNILIEGGDLNPPFIEGTRNIVHDYAKRLSLKGHKVIILTRQKSRINKKRYERVEILNCVKFYRWKNPIDLIFLYKKIVHDERIDVIHIFAKGIRSKSYLKTVRRMCRKPIVYTLLGLPSYTKEKSVKKAVKNLNSVDLCLITSKSLYHILSTHGLKNAFYLQYGIDTKKFNYQKKSVRKEKNIIFCIRPPTHNVLDAFKRINQEVKNSALLFSIRDEKPAIRDMGINGKNILFTKKEDKMGKIFSDTSIVLDLHDNKKFLECASPPAAVLEGMACKTIMVATDIPEIREVIENNENGLLIKNNTSEEIYDAIKYVLFKKNAKKIKKMRENARHTVLALYDLDKLIPEYEKIYKKLK